MIFCSLKAVALIIVEKMGFRLLLSLSLPSQSPPFNFGHFPKTNYLNRFLAS